MISTKHDGSTTKGYHKSSAQRTEAMKRKCVTEYKYMVGDGHVDQMIASIGPNKFFSTSCKWLCPMPEFFTNSVNEIRTICCSTLFKRTSLTVCAWWMRTGIHADVTLLIVDTEVLVCIRLPLFWTQSERSQSEGANCTKSMANAKTLGCTTMHVGYHFAWYHTSTNITPWNVWFPSRLCVLPQFIVVFGISHFIVLFGALQFVAFFTHAPGKQSGNFWNLLSISCSATMYKNGTRFSTKLFGNGLAMQFSNSWSFHAAVRHSDVTKVQQGHQIRWYKVEINWYIGRYLGFTDISLSAKTADFIGLSRCWQDAVILLMHPDNLRKKAQQSKSRQFFCSNACRCVFINKQTKLTMEDTSAVAAETKAPLGSFAMLEATACRCCVINSHCSSGSFCSTKCLTGTEAAEVQSMPSLAQINYEKACMNNELRCQATFVVSWIWLQMQLLLTSEDNCGCEAVASNILNDSTFLNVMY